MFVENCVATIGVCVFRGEASIEVTPFFICRSFVDMEITIPKKRKSNKLIENCTLIYTNGDSKLCNVFRFSIDKTDPNKITVYCYEDGKSFVFYRVM